MSFVVARTSGGRPSLQHYTDDHDSTACGRDISGWSRAYMRTKIKEIYCKQCDRTITKKNKKNK